MGSQPEMSRGKTCGALWGACVLWNGHHRFQGSLTAYRPEAYFFFFSTWKKGLIILLCNMFVNSDCIFYMTNTRHMLPFLLDGQRAFVSLALEDAAASPLMPGPWGGCYAVAVGKFWPGCSGDDCSWGSGFSSHLVLSTWSYVSSLLGTVSVSNQVSGYPISQQVPFCHLEEKGEQIHDQSIQYKFPL